MDLNTLTRLFDGLDSYIIAVDSEFNIKFANGRISFVSGKHPDEILNKKCYNVIHGYNKPGMCTMYYGEEDAYKEDIISLKNYITSNGYVYKKMAAV